MTVFHTRMMLFHKNPGGKPPEGPGRRPLLCGPGIWLISGRGPYGSKRGRGSPVPGVGLIPPGMNGKLGNRSLWPPEIKKWWTGHVTILTVESISHITILQSNPQVLFIMCRAKCRAAHTLWASKLQKLITVQMSLGELNSLFAWEASKKGVSENHDGNGNVAKQKI